MVYAYPKYCAINLYICFENPYIGNKKPEQVVLHFFRSEFPKSVSCNIGLQQTAYTCIYPPYA